MQLGRPKWMSHANMHVVPDLFPEEFLDMKKSRDSRAAASAAAAGSQHYDQLHQHQAQPLAKRQKKSAEAKAAPKRPQMPSVHISPTELAGNAKVLPDVGTFLYAIALASDIWELPWPAADMKMCFDAATSVIVPPGRSITVEFDPGKSAQPAAGPAQIPEDQSQWIPHENHAQEPDPLDSFWTELDE